MAVSVSGVVGAPDRITLALQLALQPEIPLFAALSYVLCILKSISSIVIAMNGLGRPFNCLSSSNSTGGRRVSGNVHLLAYVQRQDENKFTSNTTSFLRTGAQLVGKKCCHFL